MMECRGEGRLALGGKEEREEGANGGPLALGGEGRGGREGADGKERMGRPTWVLLLAMYCSCFSVLVLLCAFTYYYVYVLLLCTMSFNYDFDPIAPRPVNVEELVTGKSAGYRVNSRVSTVDARKRQAGV